MQCYEFKGEIGIRTFKTWTFHDWIIYFSGEDNLKIFFKNRLTFIIKISILGVNIVFTNWKFDRVPSSLRSVTPTADILPSALENIKKHRREKIKMVNLKRNQFYLIESIHKLFRISENRSIAPCQVAKNAISLYNLGANCPISLEIRYRMEARKSLHEVSKNLIRLKY